MRESQNDLLGVSGIAQNWSSTFIESLVTSYQLPFTGHQRVSFWLNVLQFKLLLDTGMSIVFYCLITTYGRSHLL